MSETPRSRIGIVTVSATALLVLIGVGWVVTGDRADQKSDFMGDLRHLGYHITTPASWDDESNGFWAGSVLEVKVQIAGCIVELERSDSATESTSQARGRTIRHFRIDQAGPIEDIKKSPVGALSPADVEQFLRDSYSSLECLRAN